MNTQSKSLRMACLILAIFVFMLAPGGARARCALDGAVWAQKADANTRTVTGQVVDKAGNALPKAVVHLKNTKSLQVQTRIADDSGAFHFNGLNPNIDFQLHAEHGGASSPVKTISSFDSHKNVNVALKIDKK